MQAIQMIAVVVVVDDVTDGVKDAVDDDNDAVEEGVKTMKSGAGVGRRSCVSGDEQNRM